MSNRPRSAVFTADALDDDDLGDLIPPPAATQSARPRPAPTPQETATVRAISAPHAAERQARGSGGRPSRVAGQTDPAARNSFVVVAARIPSSLWQQVTDTLLPGPERPSYAQLIAWSCHDHRREILDRLAAARDDRAPRGRRASVPQNALAVRFRTDELAWFEEVIAAAGESGVGATRTAVIIAALEVAIEHAR